MSYYQQQFQGSGGRGRGRGRGDDHRGRGNGGRDIYDRNSGVGGRGGFDVYDRNSGVGGGRGIGRGCGDDHRGRGSSGGRGSDGDRPIHFRGDPGNGHGGGRGGGGQSNYYPPRHGGGRGGSCSSSVTNGSNPDLHQARQDSYQVPNWQVGSSSSSQIFEKKSNSSHIAHEFPKLSISSKFALRPNYGEYGKLCQVTTNHFLMEINPALQYIHHYNVAIKPEIQARRLNRVVMEELVHSYKQSNLGNILLAYDGQSSFYTANSLPFNSKEFQVTTTNEGGVQKQFVVAISLVSVIDLQKLGEFLAGKHDTLPQDAIQAFDVVLRQTPMLKFVPVKRSFHCNKRTLEEIRASASGKERGDNEVCDEKIGGGLEAWYGFYQSVRPTQLGLSLNMDISAAPFVQELDVIQFVEELLFDGSKLSTTRSLSDVERLKVKRAINGLKVEVTHRGNIRPKYTISGLTKEPTTELTFLFGDGGGRKSVVTYFHETYNHIIKYNSLPCLQVGNKGTFLPMEVCKIVGGQRYIKRLNDKQTASMVALNNHKPIDRQANILEMIHLNDYPNDKFAKEFGIKIKDSPVSVPARMLPSPQLSYHSITPVQPKFGQWNMIDKKMYEGGTVHHWGCLNFAVSDNLAITFCEELAYICKIHGMHFSPSPILPPLYGAHPDQVEQKLEKLQKDARLKGVELNLLIVILPDNNGSLYGEVKRICETKLGIVTQCVLARTVKKRNRHSLANIVLKINAKVGGVNVVVKGALPMVSDRPTIIFGADVTHPSPGEDGSQSIAAVVSSQNWPNVTTYIPKFSAQAARQEIIEDLDRMIREHLHSFMENNNQQKPQRIIFYRDGVSEGQFNQVLDHELKAIKKGWVDAFNETVVPPITFVVVQKRHHTKIFPSNHHNEKLVDRSGNIIPGTVVDSGICHPNQFDFYLCSHAGIKGTSRPAHYHVLWDDNKFTADGLQILTNSLCYIYARCTRSVSYVSPAYYAHLAAFRARFYFGDDSFSDESSVRVTNESAGAPVKQVPPLCENLKNLPFYC